MPLVPWLLSLVGPMLGRVLLSLGFSVVTLVGFESGVGEVKQMLVNNTSSLPADTLNLFLLAGGGVGMNMIFGAISFRISMWAITRSTRLLGKKP